MGIAMHERRLLVREQCESGMPCHSDPELYLNRHGRHESHCCLDGPAIDRKDVVAASCNFQPGCQALHLWRVLYSSIAVADQVVFAVREPHALRLLRSCVLELLLCLTLHTYSDTSFHVVFRKSTCHVYLAQVFGPPMNLDIGNRGLHPT
jgi:hypothetical protein